MGVELEGSSALLIYSTKQMAPLASILRASVLTRVLAARGMLLQDVPPPNTTDLCNTPNDS